MSSLNNRDTLIHYLGNVWLTRPRTNPAPGDVNQGINVCVESNGEFIALDHIQLTPNGVYHKKGKPIGKLEDAAFREYIEKLAGHRGITEQTLFDQVCYLYGQNGSIHETAAAMDLSDDRVRRILITRSLLTNDLISQIAWLWDGGKGKPVKEIAEMLKVSEGTVRSNLPYPG